MNTLPLNSIFCDCRASKTTAHYRNLELLAIVTNTDFLRLFLAPGGSQTQLQLIVMVIFLVDMAKPSRKSTEKEIQSMKLKMIEPTLPRFPPKFFTTPPGTIFLAHPIIFLSQHVFGLHLQPHPHLRLLRCVSQLRFLTHNSRSRLRAYTSKGIQ